MMTFQQNLFVLNGNQWYNTKGLVFEQRVDKGHGAQREIVLLDCKTRYLNHRNII